MGAYRNFQDLSEGSRVCLALSVSVSSFQGLSASFRICQQLPGYVWHFQCLSVAFRAYQQLSESVCFGLIFTTSSPPSPPYSDIVRYCLKLIQNCLKLLEILKLVRYC